MFNIKWGGICAGAAFAVALALSLLLGQTGFLIALFRAAVFAALFFALGVAAWSLINTFVPELLSPGAGGDIATNLFSTGAAGTDAGSRVNITVDDTHSAALPEQDHGAPSSGEVGNFNDLFAPKEDIDQIPATGYTEEGEFASGTEEIASAFADIGLNEEDEAETGEFSMDFSAFVPGGLGDGGPGDDGMADESEAASDSSMDPFSLFPGGAASTSYEEPAPERKVTRNKPMKLEGDFDAREIAAGLRTVLQKDKK